MIVTLACIIVEIIYIAKRRNRPNFSKIVPDLKYEIAKSELYFRNRETIICTREAKLEIVCDKKDSIDKKFTWTGSEYFKSTLEESDGDYILEDYQRKKPPHGYVIKFNTTKYRGDKVYYKTKTVLSDGNHDMRPYLMHTVSSPTKMLELRITAPRGLIKNVKFTVYADVAGQIPISKPQPLLGEHIGDLGTFCHVEENTNLLYNYEISWEFN